MHIAGEFPGLEIAPLSRFRAGLSYSEAGKVPEAVASLLAEANAGGYFPNPAGLLLLMRRKPRRR